MKNGWQVVEIGSLCDGVFDGPHATPSKTAAGPVFLGISSLNKGRIELSEPEYLSEADFVRWTRRIAPREDDVVFSYETRLGEAAIIPKGLRCCLGRRMALMRPNPTRVNPRFLMYSFLSPEFQGVIRSRAIHGSTVDRIPLIDFPKFPLSVPAKAIQERIADILGSLDDKIELNRRTNATLEAMARAVFRSWFVDFDPVRARADGRTPQGMDASTAKLFPDSFEPSALGPIPKGWRVEPIGEVVEVVGGSTPSTDEASYWNGPHQFATPKDMAALSSPVLLTTERTITAAGLGRISSGLLAAGTVLMSSRAPIGYLAITEVPVAVNQGFIAMKCPDGMPNHYVLHWARENMDEIIAHANGTTFLEISKTNFRPLKALVPDAKVLKAFTDFVSPIHQRVVANLRESVTLAATRDALLPKLLSGEVRVQEVV